MSDQQPGVPETLEPRVVRLLAPNASPYTYTGTQTYLVGTTDLAVIDPGPEDPDHLQAILAALNGRPLRAIVITHTHRDHSPGARALKAATVHRSSAAPRWHWMTKESVRTPHSTATMRPTP